MSQFKFPPRPNDRWLEPPRPRGRPRLPDDSWLEAPPQPFTPEQARAAVHAAAMDDASEARRDVAVPEGLPAAEARLVRALRALRPIQRIYLRAYIQHGCNRSAATRVVNNRGVALPNGSSITRWFTRPEFKVALDGLKKLYLDTAGLDPQSVILKAGQVYETAMDPQPILHQGEDTGFREVDLGNAMRAVEFMGRVNKMTTGDENGARVTLHIVNIADREVRDVVSEQ